MSKLFCLCADDFALTETISQSIVTLLENGRIQATSCMTQSPYWASMSQQLTLMTTPVQIGLHINFTQDFDGYMSLPLKQLMVKAWTHQLSRDSILQSISQQWQAFVDAMGRAPDFVDGHQHVHQFPVLRDVLVAFLKQQNYQGWVRNVANCLATPNDKLGNRVKTWLLPNLGAKQLQTTCQSLAIAQNRLFAGIYDFDATVDYANYMQGWMASAPKQSSTLLMCHPSQTIADDVDPIAQARVKEYAYLASAQFVEDCQRFDIQLGQIGGVHG